MRILVYPDAGDGFVIPCEIGALENGTSFAEGLAQFAAGERVSSDWLFVCETGDPMLCPSEGELCMTCANAHLTLLRPEVG